MEYLNNINEYYDEMFPVTNEQKVLFQELAGDIMPARFLRVNCGTGSFENYLSKAGHDVTGIDTSRELLEAAARRRRLPNMAIRFFEMSTLEMTRFLGKGFYNVIYCLNDSIIFISNSTLIRKFFYDCKTMLAPNGYLVLQLTNFAKFRNNSAINLPIKENIRVKLYSDITCNEDQSCFLTQKFEHSCNKPVLLLDKVPVLPIDTDEIKTFGYEAGFTNIQFYENYERKELTPESDSIVCIMQ